MARALYLRPFFPAARRRFLLVTEILFQLAPIFLYFAIGVLLRHLKLAERSHGDFVLRLAFFVTLPLLILITLEDTTLTLDKAMLPIANIVVNVLCFASIVLAMRPLKLTKTTRGAMVMNTMIANNAFMFPFMLAIFGQSGFADAILFDFGNAIMVATVTYAVAFRYSDAEYDRFAMLRRIASGPLFWALAIGVALSLTGTRMPERLTETVEPLARMSAPLILIALGIHFALDLRRMRLVGLALFVRMGLGFVFGLGFGWVVGLEGQELAVVALCSGAPIGFTALTFSSMAKLDMDLTTSAVSISILVGLFYVPLLMLLF